ncbi:MULTISPECIES: hypothetical protein [Paraburkholderia]|jgi:hypothetical protein|uniref:DUF1010 domain-containing protein n=1 Tax=Paraburkholderia madseniana TaxID=2599607 RepID=A0A6N6W5A1_9BURK|nr:MULTISPECIES: hypothetical protein [Paraburkholderia]KAE8755792.1 hypothetical protein FSO04_32550 [Paraburkholderia madseniana]MCX4177049.1 hypothetical protein [Paraburkholderia madseniana]MDQ6465039.1 hypothetical protein [Paraburkholderia madseniana]NPT70733.1 hypothetical protein [Paraburkholderia madseniana]
MLRFKRLFSRCLFSGLTIDRLGDALHSVAFLLVATAFSGSLRIFRPLAAPVAARCATSSLVVFPVAFPGFFRNLVAQSHSTANHAA